MFCDYGSSFLDLCYTISDLIRFCYNNFIINITIIIIIIINIIVIIIIIIILLIYSIQ